MKSHLKWKPVAEEELRRRVEAGESASEIARGMGRSISAIQTKMYRLALVRR